jgi:D-3-phosphoglycerate dehydrogenase
MPTVLLSAPYMIPEVKRFEPVFAYFGLELIQPAVNERLSEEELLAYAGQLTLPSAGRSIY